MNSQINQNDFFGNTKKAFSLATLNNFAEADLVTDHTFDKTKKYFLTYFAKSLNDVFYEFSPQEDEEEGHIINREHLNGVWSSVMKELSYIEHNRKIVFNLKEWFMKAHYQTYKINSDPRCSRFYVSPKTDQAFINLSKGFLHKTIKKYDSYPQNVKDDVEKIISHITNVWNSGNEDCSEFCLNFLAHALTGHKMQTALFLKSGEGTGKSIILDFIIRHVIGEDLGLSTPRVQQLMKFNSQLLGKIFICLEELPTASKAEWHSVADYLKDLITGSKIDIEKKFQDCVQTVNLMSLVILTNNENTIKFGKDARRYMMCDVSHDKVGNSSYFNQLSKACTRQTGEAFFMWLIERYESTLDFKNVIECPLTDAKREMKTVNLTNILKYVKEEYVKKEIGLSNPNVKHEMIKLNDLKDEINFKYQTNLSTTAFTIKLKCDIPKVETVIYGANKYIYIKPISASDLLEFYIQKGFWCKVNDAFESCTTDNGLDDEQISNAQIIKNQAQIIKQLQDDLRKERECREMLAEIHRQNNILLQIENQIREQNIKISAQEKEIKQIKLDAVQPKKTPLKEIIDDIEDEDFLDLFSDCL